MVLWIPKSVVELKNPAKHLVNWKNGSGQTKTSHSILKSVSQIMCPACSHVLFGDMDYIYHIKALERFHQKCLRHTLNINWQSFNTRQLLCSALIQNMHQRKTAHSQSTALDMASQENGRWNFSLAPVLWRACSW